MWFLFLGSWSLRNFFVWNNSVVIFYWLEKSYMDFKVFVKLFILIKVVIINEREFRKNK